MSAPSWPRPSQLLPRTVFVACFCALAVLALVFFLFRTRHSIAIAVGAVLLALALNHPVEALQRRRVPRSVAIGVVFVGLIGVLVGLGFVVIPAAVAQGRAFVHEVPALWDKAQRSPLLAELDERLHLEEQLTPSAGSAAGAIDPVLAAIGSILGVVVGTVTITFLTIFVLVFGPDLVAGFLAEVDPSARERYQRVGQGIYRSVGGYLGGLAGICGINAVLTATFLAITRMPFFLPLAILSGLSSLVPYAGPLLTGASVTLLALLTGGVWKALATAIYFVLYGQLEGNVLGPLVYRRTAHVNPLVTLLSILFLAEFMGVAGAVIAVPLAAAGQIVLRELLALRREARTSRTATTA
ncbi:MAG: AI-2E family transporter [Deltaproteobacteria bacterium]|nr:AI-2E family transporter [Deltaproteobacteria bacterium]